MNGKLIKPVFIICLHRTGSTFLKNLLDSNSYLAMATDEMHILDPFRFTFGNIFSKLKKKHNINISYHLVDKVYNGEIYGSFWNDYKKLSISKERILRRIDVSNVTIKLIISTLLDEYRILQSKKRVGVKYPLHFSKTLKLKEWFPDAKIIFLVRDPRAICASKLNDHATKRRKFNLKIFSPIIHYITLFWFVFEFNWSINYFVKYLKRQRDVYNLKYEDLVSDPKKNIRNICNFCEIPFEETMFTAHGKPSSYDGLIQYGVSSDKIYQWKKVLNRFDKIFITIFTKNAMKKIKYI